MQWKSKPWLKYIRLVFNIASLFKNENIFNDDIYGLLIFDAIDIIIKVSVVKISKRKITTGSKVWNDPSLLVTIFSKKNFVPKASMQFSR